MKKNDDIQLKIESVTGTGSGIGRFGGMVVFVAGAAPGDELIAHIIKVKKNYAIGIIQQLLKPSVSRKPVDCPVFGRCGGCAYRHIHYRAECAIKQQAVQDAMQRIGGVSLSAQPILAAEETTGYRNKAQYPVAQDKNGIYFGFYAGHTHRVVPHPYCRLQPALFETALSAVKQWADAHHLCAYNEQTGKGLLRHILIRYAQSSNQLMVVPVIHAESLPFSEDLVQRLTEALGDSFQTLCYNINRKNTNVVLGDQCVTVFGDGFITDEICGVRVQIAPQSFYQVNRTMAEKLYQKAAGYFDLQDQNIIDLFCGTGTIGLSVLRLLGGAERNLIGVEIVPQAVKNAKENARLAGVNARFICGDAGQAAEQLLSEGVSADVVIVDPPRKGCDLKLLHTITTGFRPKKLIYISCDPATLARDTAVLTENGYLLQEYTPVDLFPGTAHVETICLLSKLNAKQHIEINLDMDELDLTDAEKKATYQEIKDYVLEHSGLKVSSLYIAQVKQKCGIIERENYNKPKSEDAKQPQCPPDKEKAIKEALTHFGMI